MALYDVALFGDQSTISLNRINVPYAEKLSDTRFVVAWSQTSTVKAVRVVELNRTTGDTTPLSTQFNFYTTSYNPTDYDIMSISAIDDSHFIIFWTGSSNDGYCRTFQVNPSTGEVTYWGSELEFETSGSNISGYNSSILMNVDSNYAYVLNCWCGPSDDGFSQIFRIDRSDGSINQMGSPFEFNTSSGTYISVSKISNSKALVCYTGPGDDGYAVVLNIDTSTWAVSAAGILFEWLNTSTISQNSVNIISETPLTAINAFQNAGNFGFRQLSINNSTWEISNLGTQVTSLSSVNQHNSKRILFRIDDEHFISFYAAMAGSDIDGRVGVFNYNNTTGAISQHNFVYFLDNIESPLTAVDMGQGIFVGIGYAGDGFVQSVRVELPSPETKSNLPMMHHMQIVGGLIN